MFKRICHIWHISQIVLLFKFMAAEVEEKRRNDTFRLINDYKIGIYFLYINF